MATFKIGGVPEHFSIPWTSGEQIFQEAGLAMTYEEYPRGTGSMTSALRSGELDIAVALTEGLVAG